MGGPCLEAMMGIVSVWKLESEVANAKDKKKRVANA